jgi:hypothetical protein
MELKKLKDTVKEVMKQDSKTRNSDKWLILQTLRKLGFKIYVDYDKLSEMPSFESITRCRRKIQNGDHELLPTEKIDNRRTKLEKEHREFFR